MDFQLTRQQREEAQRQADPNVPTATEADALISALNSQQRDRKVVFRRL
jgi:hypothetical protein